MIVSHRSIVISTTRPGRFGEVPTNWLFNIAKERNDADFEIVDLRDYPMPFFEEKVPLHVVPPQNEVALRWGEKIASLDGYIFVTAEYNHSIPAVLKNAIDWASRPYGDNVWDGKPVGIMGASIGMLGTARAQYHLRQMFVFLNMFPLNQPEVMIPYAENKFDNEGNLTDQITSQKISELLKTLVEWTKTVEKAKPAPTGGRFFS